MPNILCTGAASGLGLAFIKAYSANPSNNIIAVDRAPVPVEPSNHDNVKTYTLDITSPTDVQSFAESFGDMPLDLIVHSAGIRGLVPAVEEAHTEDVARAETLEAMDMETMMRTFLINTAGTFEVIRALLPNIRRVASQRNAMPRVIIMSSRMGSISYNSTGGGYAYRASKAALNAIVKSFSLDVREATFIMVHPGRVETGLVKIKEEGAITAEESVRDMLKLIDGLTKDDSGRFMDRWGKDIGW